jgi:putative ABC transport system permease protein
MENFLRIWAIFIVTLKRMVAQRTMALATLLGVIAAIAITMSIPMYADAAYQKIYNTGLIEGQANGLFIGNHPPYAFMFRYIGAWNGPIPLDQIRPVDAYLSGRFPQDITLPPKLFVRYLDTATFQLFPAQGADFNNNTQSLDYVNFAAATGFADHVAVTGKLPSGYDESTRTVSVLVSQ